MPGRSIDGIANELLGMTPIRCFVDEIDKSLRDLARSETVSHSQVVPKVIVPEPDSVGARPQADKSEPMVADETPPSV